MKTVKAVFDNGDFIITGFNASVGDEEIKKYYLGRFFNIGSVSDSMHKCVKVEFLDQEEKE